MREAELADRWEIHDLILAYATAVDERDWETFEALWVPDAQIDYTSAGGISGKPAVVTAWLREAMAMYAMTQHSVSTHVVRLNGDEAWGRANVWTRQAAEADGEHLFLDVGGWYEDTYLRTEDGWRFSSRTEHTMWFDGPVADKYRLEKVPESARKPTTLPG
jgi:hypothetical protein